MISTDTQLAVTLVCALLTGCAGPGPSPAGGDAQARATVPQSAQVLFDASLEAIAHKRWDQAERQLLELTREYPAYSGAWFNLGVVRHVNGSEQGAEEALRASLKANPENLEAYNYLAAMLRQQGRFADSEQLYLQALAHSPQHGDSHLNLGILYDMYMGDLNRARDHYQRYQTLREEPDRLVQGWIMDIERREPQLAGTGL